MINNIPSLALTMLLAPFIGAFIAGIFGKQIGKRGAHSVTILGMIISTVAAALLFKIMALDGAPAYNANIYTWGVSGSFTFNAGFLIDRLSTMMLLTVDIVSLLVHIYSIGYMRGDPGYQRFFSYMSLFTFFMLALTSANNFLQLFFGWEGVGLVSYLLIGFWYGKDSAANGGLKAFIVNRVGDFGFILGLAAVLDYFSSLDYATVFAQAPNVVNTTATIFPGLHGSIITVICILLFIGAMGKSAQMPLHVWLPESMEGPTPISALIHAATMVTAGVYMVARLSPMFELSPVALSVVLIVGATGALFMGLVGLVQDDIKRVIAYSTMSQLGYMMAAAGASAYAASIFHLVTHAYFKALLFLAAGSVIIAMHHEQNLWKMGNLRKYMPITYITFLIGALSLSAVPPFAGYYSKDAIIAAVHLSNIPGAGYAYCCLLLGAFVTALYIFRAFFLAFHTQERMDEEVRKELRESPLSVTVPLILLAVPSIFLGMIMVKPALYSATDSLFGNSIYVVARHDVIAKMAVHFTSVLKLTLQGFIALPVWFGLAGIFVAWFSYVRCPALPGVFKQRLALIYRILVAKYGFDKLNNFVFVRGGRSLSHFLYVFADMKLIDDWLVNGSGRSINYLSRWLRRLQTGYLYHYAFAMIIGLCVLLGWLVLK